MTQIVKHGAEDTARDLVCLSLGSAKGIVEWASLAILLELPAARVPCGLLVLAHLISEAGSDLDTTVASKPWTLHEATKTLG